MIHISDTSADSSLAVDRVREQCRHGAEASELLNVCCELFLSCSRSPQPHGKRNMSLPSSSASLFTLYSAHCNCRGSCRDAEKLRDCPAADRGRSLLMWGRERGRGKGKGENEEKSGHADVQREEGEGKRCTKHTIDICAIDSAY
ncbi:hypothetical protein WR25_21990 [Diploscapter pachys]|uniref:Uncharacterized protein n=1 Tax=Diploscapter pachys TaxID=2018661 RepID=A0A2A2L9L0_9BILA|nr:hypothetical protein WR25_21990 [Diploscapter pachys]